MKGLKQVSDKTQNINSRDRSTWLPLFYSFATDTVYTVPGNDRFHVTDLINPNTKEDIEQAVRRFINS